MVWYKLLVIIELIIHFVKLGGIVSQTIYLQNTSPLDIIKFSLVKKIFDFAIMTKITIFLYVLKFKMICDFERTYFLFVWEIQLKNGANYFFSGFCLYLPTAMDLSKLTLLLYCFLPSLWRLISSFTVFFLFVDS